MTATVAIGERFGTGGPLSFRTPWAGHRVLVTTPTADPDLWRAYLSGARASYGAHGATGALELDSVEDGASTSLVFLAVTAEGLPVAGMRAQGPYAVADEAQALAAWAGSPGQPGVRAMIEQRLPHGVVESKGLWAARDFPGRRELVRCLGRGPLHASTILGARFALGTTAAHTEKLWTSTGAVVARELPAVGYPSEQYRTQLIWWDRWALPPSVSDEEKRAIDDETAQLLRVRLPSPRRPL